MLYVLILWGLSIPWTQQHLLYPVDYCRLSAACVHDGVQVCATAPSCCEHRTFLDQCDMYEYNCDFGTRYQQTYNLLCNGLIPHLMPKMSSTTMKATKVSKLKMVTTETTTTPCCDRPTLWDTTTTENIEITTTYTKVNNTSTAVQSTTSATATSCCDRPNTWETTIPYTKEKIPTTYSTTKKELTIPATSISTSTKPIITTPVSKPTITTSKTTTPKKEINYNLTAKTTIACCDRPKLWETTAYSEVIFFDNLASTTSIPITMTTKNILTLKTTTANTKTSAKQMTSTKTSLKDIKTTTTPSTYTKTIKTSIIPTSFAETPLEVTTVCCDRPKVWETTTYSEIVLPDKTEFTTTIPIKLTSTNKTSLETTTTKDNTESSTSHLTSTKTDPIWTKTTSEPTKILDATPETTTVCCDRPKVWETTETRHTYESIEATNASETSRNYDFTKSTTYAQSTKMKSQTSGTYSQTSKTYSQPSRPYSLTSTLQTNTETTSAHSQTSTTQTNEETAGTNTQTSGSFSQTKELTSKTTKPSSELTPSITSSSYSTTKNIDIVAPETVHISTVTARATENDEISTLKSSHSSTFYSTKTSQATSNQHLHLTKTKTIKTTSSKTRHTTQRTITNKLIHSTTTWWYPRRCRNGKCENPVWWYTTRDRRRKFNRRNDNKIPQWRK